MKIDIKGTLLELTPAIKEYVQKKLAPLSRLMKTFEAEGETTAFIEIARTTKHHKRGEVYYAEATLLFAGKSLRVERYHRDIRAAIDLMRDTLKAEILRQKEKVERKRIGK